MVNIQSQSCSICLQIHFDGMVPFGEHSAANRYFLLFNSPELCCYFSFTDLKLNSPSPDCLLCAPCTNKRFLWYLWTDCNTNCVPQLVLKTFSVCPAIKYPTRGISQLMSVYFDFWPSVNLPKLPTMDGTKVILFPHINKYGKKSFTKTPLRMRFLFSLRKILTRLDYSVAFWICSFPLRIFTVVALIYYQ